MRRTTIFLLGMILLAAATVRAGAQSADVTKLVKSHVNGCSLAISADNTTMGGDPVSGGKKLKVEYLLNGMTRIKIVPENSMLRINLPEGNALVITKAAYGKFTEAITDATDVLLAAVKDNRLRINVEDSLLSDPAPYKRKELHIDYSVGGVPHSAIYSQSDAVDLPLPTDGNGVLAIINAGYGYFE